MSADPTANLQLFSPPGSGRSSPAPRATRNAAEDSLYKKDKGFRRYAAGVERALALWDTAQQEWADYISFLGRLLKALQAHPAEVPVIPHSEKVALRLAQCLNPALPSGVHQKALEVYAYIFATIGKDALAHDLSIYFPGLASVPSFASLSVRPLFLAIFENHILKLDASALRPALKATILSLLPGLEDETSEDFERMFSALDKLRKAIEEPSKEVNNENESSHFWQCFFLATITNASRRQGALAFLVRRLPKFGLTRRRSSTRAEESAPTTSLSAEAEAAISPEPGLLIRCFESGLSDPQLLIQRGFLDLLVTQLPLNSPVLQEHIGKCDLERLVTAAAGVVSRRDMSLNRRLWAWFLGPEPNATESNEQIASPTRGKHGDRDPATLHAAFFSCYGLEALTSSVLKLIRRPSKTAAERARPFRVCLSLMDRWEVGGLIVPEIFLPALQSVQSYSETSTREQTDEVLRSASAFFDGVDSGLIWGKLIQLVTSAVESGGSNQQEALDNLKLAKFVLARFNLKEEDMIIHHMPLMVLSTLATLNATSQDAKRSPLHITIAGLALEIADSLLQILPERAVLADNIPHQQASAASEVPRDGILRRLKEFYEENQGSIDTVDPPFSRIELGQCLLSQAAHMYIGSLQRNVASPSTEFPSRILSNLIFKVRQLAALDQYDLSGAFRELISDSEEMARPTSFGRLSAVTTVLTALQTTHPSTPYVPMSDLPELVHPLVATLWQYLSPTKPKYHVEATRCLLQLHTISPTSRMVEASVASVIDKQSSHNSSIKGSYDSSRHFAIFWTHTMHELNVQSEKRGNMARRPSGHLKPAPALPPGEYHAILTRPLLLLLDTFLEQGTETYAFISRWLQDLPSLARVFDILVLRLQSLQCLASDTQSAVTDKPKGISDISRKDDSKECLYYLQHISNVLKTPSQHVWSTLAETPLSWSENMSSRATLQEWLVQTCLKVMALRINGTATAEEPHTYELHRLSVSILSQIFQSPFATQLRELELEVPLMERIKTAPPSLQSLLLAATLSALHLRLTRPPLEAPPEAELKVPTQPSHRSRLSLALTRESEDIEPPPIPPPSQLIDCLKHGFSSPNSRLILDDWVQFLIEVLPLFADTIFQSLLPLVECFCKQIDMCFEELKSTFSKGETTMETSPESTLVSLINGLEQVLAKAHDRLTIQETKASANKSPEQPQGFFSNVVSGVFTSDTAQTRTPTANSRLTVLLCFQDTVRICFAIWSWGGYGHLAKQDVASAGSFAFTSLRMRNRARRILEHLFAAEALECLETLAVLWTKAAKGDDQDISIMGLLNVLNGSIPKHTIPNVFNAIYSRTDPSALDPSRASTLTSDLSDAELVTFLVEYTKSLEDDAMDEIWQDCTLFLRDVLANPLPHRQILPTLLEFAAVIGQKVDNTNFGEQRKMRRELADIFTRILTAISTTRSLGYVQVAPPTLVDEKPSASTNGARAQQHASDIVAILTSIAPKLPLVLVENDRVVKVVSDLSTSIIGPSFRAKMFPENISKSMLDLLQALTRIAQNNKLLKKDIADAFNDAKFFNTPVELLRESWLPILAQWTQSDKERVPEYLARISAPTTAGIMFGVGAASARQEADRKTQMTLRRVALLVLASPEDAYTPNVPFILEKVVELLTATPATSPSSTTRADVLILLRAVILKTSPVHLAPLWPVANGELAASLSSLLPNASNSEHYNNASILQACKLLDELVVLDPDDFQLSEWLFLCDTIDAVYKPATPPIQLSLTEEINEVLSQSGSGAVPIPPLNVDVDELPSRKLTLDPLIWSLEEEEGAAVLDMARAELVTRVVRPFLGNLALNAFEARYGGGDADWQGIWESVVRDAGS